MISASTWTPPDTRTVSVAAKPTVDEWVDRYIAEPDLEQTTVDNYRKCQALFTSDLGSVPLDLVTRGQVASWYALLDRMKAPRNWNSYASSGTSTTTPSSSR